MMLKIKIELKGKIKNNNYFLNHLWSSLLGDDGIKLLKAEVIVSFGLIHDVSIVHEFSELIIVEGFAQFSGDSLEAIEISVAVSFFIPNLENTGDAVSGFSVTYFWANYL